MSQPSGVMRHYRVRYCARHEAGTVMQLDRLVDAEHGDEAIARSRPYAEAQMARHGIPATDVHLDRLGPWDPRQEGSAA